MSGVRGESKEILARLEGPRAALSYGTWDLSWIWKNVLVSWKDMIVGEENVPQKKQKPQYEQRWEGLNSMQYTEHCKKLYVPERNMLALMLQMVL